MGSKQQGANFTQGRWLTICRTLCFVIHGSDVLLMKRAPNRRIFPNQYNGLGGHLERDETPYDGAIREVKEESGLDVDSLTLRGIHHIDSGEDTGIILFTFTATTTQRDLTVSSPEGTLHWIPIAQVYDYDLVEDLPNILPRILNMGEADTPYFVHVSYDQADEIILKFSNTEADTDAIDE